jgi:hypothetical protein
VSKYILRFTGRGEKPRKDVRKIEDAPLRIVDDSSPRMVLVDGAPDVVKELEASLDDWTAIAEQMVPLPDTRERVRRHINDE